MNSIFANNILLLSIFMITLDIELLMFIYIFKMKYLKVKYIVT